MSYGGTSTAIIAASKKNERERKEEEDMTRYNNNNLDGWEFKIVRSFTGSFKSHTDVQKVIEEESKAGWQFLEKFDNYRMRFKRRIEKRSGDQFLDIDPYRTQVGIGSGSLGAVIIAITLFIIGLLVLLAILINK
jgi:hypothetical protein